MPRDPKWSDVTKVVRVCKANCSVICKYCSAVWYNNSVVQIDEHIVKCPQLPEALYRRYERGGEPPKKKQRQGTLNREEYLMPMADQRAADALLAEAIYSSGVAFSFVSDLLFREYSARLHSVVRMKTLPF
jgi:hypothetical protein